MRASRAVIERLVADGATVYGVTTGFGDLADTRVDPAQTSALQRNLVRSHAAGVGDPLPDDVVRAMLLLRANALAVGLSGVRVEVVDLLVAMLNAAIHPVVPSRGSLGASGDLAPLAHVALVLIGEGEATVDGAGPGGGAEALARAGLEPIELEAKEGLALLNGTQLMAGIGALAHHDAMRLALTADVIGAMSLEAMLGTGAAFAEELIAARPHPGQVASAGTCASCWRTARSGRPIAPIPSTGCRTPTASDACRRSMAPLATRWPSSSASSASRSTRRPTTHSSSRRER